MFRDGIGCDKNEEKAQKHFSDAFHGFTSLEKQSHDDKLQYRLGWMLLNGIGTEKDIMQARSYFEKAALVGNSFAAYQLGKLYLGGEGILKDIPEALRWFSISAQQKNQFAEYALGCLYLKGGDVTKDVAKAISYLKSAAIKGNEFAEYRLGKLYLTGEDIPKNVETVLQYLTASAKQGNQYAQYTLGKLYLMGKDILKDKEEAVKWFTLSAAQGNIYAQFFLDHIDEFKEPSVMLVATRLLHHMSRISENTRWGLVRRFENGIVSVNHNKFLGYTKDKNGELAIVPEEAELVRRIFRLYLEGSSVIQIAKLLESEGITTVTGATKWWDSTINKMLSNEKYMGDVLQQKTYTIDFLTKKRVKNDGIVPQYYIEDDHEAIIPKELFYQVQEEKTRRASLSKTAAARRAKQEQAKEKSKYSSKFALSEIMVCKECGQPYRRQVWSKYGQKSAVWRCENRLKNGTKNCKHSPTFKEDVLHEAVMTAINSVVENHGEFVGAFRENVIRVIGSYSTKNVPTEYDGQIERLQGEMLVLIEENARQGAVTEDFDERYKGISEQINALKQKKLEMVREQKMAENFQQRLDDMDACLKKTTCEVKDFDNDLVRRLLQSIKAVKNDMIEIQFKSGIVMNQRISYFD